jgi:dihydrofolate reductase
MSKLRLNITMSLDGYVAGPDQSEENPLGVGGGQLHEWLLPLRAFRESHGEEGGEVNASSSIVEGWFENIGAFVMGRNMFGGGPGPWGEDQWPGWWGDDPPYHNPVFVLTHHEREPLEMEGGTTFHFVTDGIESALAQAKDAAGGKDVSLAGGAQAVQQYLAAGLLDEMTISVVPLLLGGGSRLFDNVGDADFELEQVRSVESPGVTHLSYRVAKG